MINWSTDEKIFKKENPKEHKIWRITQLINYGLDGEKIKTKDLKMFWHLIENKIDKPTQSFLRYLIWGKKPSLTRISKIS